MMLFYLVRAAVIDRNVPLATSFICLQPAQSGRGVHR